MVHSLLVCWPNNFSVRQLWSKSHMHYLHRTRHAAAKISRIAHIAGVWLENMAVTGISPQRSIFDAMRHATERSQPNHSDSSEDHGQISEWQR